MAGRHRNCLQGGQDTWEGLPGQCSCLNEQGLREIRAGWWLLTINRIKLNMPQRTLTLSFYRESRWSSWFVWILEYSNHWAQTEGPAVWGACRAQKHLLPLGNSLTAAAWRAAPAGWAHTQPFRNTSSSQVCPHCSSPAQKPKVNPVQGWQQEGAGGFCRYSRYSTVLMRNEIWCGLCRPIQREHSGKPL